MRPIQRLLQSAPIEGGKAEYGRTAGKFKDLWKRKEKVISGLRDIRERRKGFTPYCTKPG